MKEISPSVIAVGAMIIALVWSLMQEPSRLEGTARPLPEVASTAEGAPVQSN